MGSRTPAVAGLYHYTTTPYQTKEANQAAVNIGLHYIASASGKAMDSDAGGGDGIPDYVENWHGDGDYPSHTDTETDWQQPATATDPTTGQPIPDAQNILYDNADLDGDGMVGRVEKALGTNPLLPDNPVILSQSGAGVFEVALNYASLSTFGHLRLMLDGSAPFLQEFVQGADGNAQVAWNTAYSPPGAHVAQMQLSLAQSLVIVGDPEDAVYSAMGPLVAININNVVQFDPFYSEYTSQAGATLYASLTQSTANYSIEMKTLAGAHIKTIPGSAAGGVINESWDLKDDNGNQYTGGPFVANFAVNFPDGTSGSASQIVNGPVPTATDGDFVSACAWDISGEFTGVQNAVQFGVVDLVLNPANFALPGPAYNYLAINKPSSGGLGGKPGWLASQTDMDTLVNTYLPNSLTRNFYFRGHGNASGQIGNNESGSGGLGTDYLTVGLKLGNRVQHSGGAANYNVFLARNNPYRFVWIDCCNSSDDPAWATAFGVLPVITTAELQSDPTKAQAFVGWVKKPRAPKGSDWTDYQNTLGVVFNQWMAGNVPLSTCLSRATKRDPYGDGSVILNFPLGAKFTYFNGGGFGYTKLNNFYYKVYGYAGITRQGFL